MLEKSKNQLVGKIIYVNNYGNLISNIPKQLFDEFLKSTNNFFIQIAKEKIYKTTKHCYEVNDGDIFSIFNNIDLLEVGIYHGNAKQLLGTTIGAPISINLFQFYYLYNIYLLILHITTIIKYFLSDNKIYKYNYFCDNAFLWMSI